MLSRVSRDQAGYSLVEVLVSIILLGIAILPMAGMFDMGLRAATTGSNYDQARVLANANLAKVKALPYDTAVSKYRPVNAVPAPVPETVSCNQGIFTCEVRTTFVNDSLNNDPNGVLKMRVEVTVSWDGGKSFQTIGLVAK